MSVSGGVYKKRAAKRVKKCNTKRAERNPWNDATSNVRTRKRFSLHASPTRGEILVVSVSQARLFPRNHATKWKPGKSAPLPTHLRFRAIDLGETSHDATRKKTRDFSLTISVRFIRLIVCRVVRGLGHLDFSILSLRWYSTTVAMISFRSVFLSKDLTRDFFFSFLGVVLFVFSLIQQRDDDDDDERIVCFFFLVFRAQVTRECVKKEKFLYF